MKATPRPECLETANARVILGHARGTVKAFDEAFSIVRAKRGVTVGAPTDEEQIFCVRRWSLRLRDSTRSPSI